MSTKRLDLLRALGGTEPRAIVPADSRVRVVAVRRGYAEEKVSEKMDRSEVLLDICVQAAELRARAEAAEKERDALQAQVTELQARMTEMVETQLHRRVADFYAEVVGKPFAGGPPRVPPPEELRAKLRLVIEEFEELLCASGMPDVGAIMCDVSAYYSADLVQMADACADLMYAVQGLALACGIHLPPAIDEVHRSTSSSGLDRRE